MSMRQLERDFGALHFYWPSYRRALRKTDTLQSLGVQSCQAFAMVAVVKASSDEPQPVWTPPDDPIYSVGQDDGDQESHCSASMVDDACPNGHPLVPFRSDGDWTCDRCMQDVPHGELVYGCQPCDFGSRCKCACLVGPETTSVRVPQTAVDALLGGCHVSCPSLGRQRPQAKRSMAAIFGPWPRVFRHIALSFLQ